ncbi:hypothetical protein EHV15_05040 [Paenibacillus oralis]|uniref:Uncharacterized protein n=1 Tax=Paenibacillus oralis TaxID=2490856 RepID=A0A3P3TW79_9BACL|nr:hypothetical protein [Paenibacillus oralis]RRJ62385.1 hypothetical protein EHV15_05040 [Paenibacillus oralis]
MSDPKENVGKIFKSLEKYFDPGAGRIKVKSRPVLVIGYERNATSYFNIDYETLPISSLGNFEPDPDFDILITQQTQTKLGLNKTSYIRTHKTAWNHCKNMAIDAEIGDLKSEFPALFEKILKLNEKWVSDRNTANLTEEQESVS